MTDIAMNNAEVQISETSFDLFSDLLNSFSTMRPRELGVFDCLDWKKIQIWHESMQADLQRNKEDGHDFNIFSLLYDDLDISIQETMHSKLLKFLFDKNASHGQEKLFLCSFLTKIGISEPEKGYWQVTAERGRVDILLVRQEPLSVVVIENKSNWASDQPNQLYRYWYEQIFFRTKEIKNEFYSQKEQYFQILYLVPNGLKKYEEQSKSRPSDYPDSKPEKVPMDIKIQTFDDFIQEWLDDCIGKLNTENYRVRTYLEQYKELCNNL